MDHVVDFAALERTSFAAGQPFGDAGPYERLIGKATFKIDPADGRNRGIVDLAYAPVGEDELVAYRADVCILKPVDLSAGNGRLVFEFVNRGNKRLLQFFNDAPPGNMPIHAADAGNGFLLRQGYTIVWLGWQGDLWPGDDRVVLEAPLARLPEGPIEGEVFSEFIANARGVKVFPLSAATTSRSYPVAQHAKGQARLTRRRYYGSSREEVARDRWQFARTEGGQGADNQGAELAILPSDTHIYLPEGFEPGWIYELIYTAQDPLVLGLGHSAVRDFISFLKHGQHTNSGQPNPLRQGDAGIKKAYCWGRSQSGRCIRDFIYLGFNEDLEGRQVFEGAMPHVAGAGKMWLNHRFAKPTLLPGQTHDNHSAPADVFPFSYARSCDHITGAEDAILKRPASDPFVIHTDSAAEYWHRRASLVHTDTEGRDLTLPDNVRIYLWSSSQHWASPIVNELSTGIAEQFFNPVSTSMFFRAAVQRLDDWVTRGVAPPPSRFPLAQDGTLVTGKSWLDSFPRIPGVSLPTGPSRLERMDYGPRFAEGLLETVPPRIDPDVEYAVLVPAVDEDGNDIAGLRAPMVEAPLGTYTGWSMRRREFGPGVMLGVTGSYMPFPETEEVALLTNDPRAPVSLRFAVVEDYADAIRKAATVLVEAGFILDEDVSRCVAMARDWGRPRHRITLSLAGKTA
ncbi:alpha/beta hydrolase domain-containing protein [Bosea sp. LjRoot9]|uniref:alpha/beta hydrolase domain-containing protein n=1 Tax=Bosea sp. LjRoot9 TaxID=3342341 RepID=UPI003ED07698